MTRLFDGAKVARSRMTLAEQQAAELEAEKAIAELGEMQAASAKLGDLLGKGRAVQAVQYHKYRKPGGRWQLEHALADDDLVIQCFPLRPTRMDWRDVILNMIAVMDSIYPRTVPINYAPPEPPGGAIKMPVTFYTIRVKSVARMPGFEFARDKSLAGLVNVEAW